MTRHFSSSGFSLIEMLVYIALLVLITGVAVASLLSFSTSFQRYQAEKTLNQQAKGILDRIQLDLRNATMVDVPGSTFGVSPGTLELINGTDNTIYSLSGGNVVLTENGVLTGPLNTTPVTVDSLIFEHYDNSITELVQVLLTLTVTAGGLVETETYQTSMILRGSYE